MLWDPNPEKDSESSWLEVSYDETVAFAAGFEMPSTLFTLLVLTVFGDTPWLLLDIWSYGFSIVIQFLLF